MAAEQQVKVVIQGEDKTSGAFKSASKNVLGLNTDVSALSKTLLGGVVAGGVALTGFLISAAKGAADAEVQVAKVTATLTAMGAGALKNKDAILQASQAAVKLGFDDEAAALSITKFYQRTQDLTKATELNNLAMDLARAKTIDLESASNLVGQALSGNGRVLAAYGISIKEAATPLEALAELQKAVGGQSAEFAGTFQGQMMILEESVSNLKDTIGASLLEAINPLLKTFTEWATKKETQQKIQEIANALGMLAKDVIPVAVDAFKILVEWGTNLYNIMLKVGNAIIAAIEALQRFNNSAVGQDIGKNGLIAPVARAVNNGINNLFGINGARANGGPVMAGGSYLVGERGPEIFSPSSSGRIIPNGGGGITINITGNQLLSESAGEMISRQIMDVLKTNLRI